MPQLFFTDLSALPRSVTIDGVAHALEADKIAAAEKLGLVEGMPFILGGEGSYDHNLNRFLRSCPTMGVRSLNSLRAYARDIVVWMRFLEERRGGKSVWAANRDDIAAFHQARRLSEPPFRISASSWNRTIAALDKLYRWAVDEKIITTAPFTYRQLWSRAPTSGAVVSVAINCAKESGGRNGDVQFLDMPRYLVFRDVGLRGRLPDGQEDPSWRGRNGTRNALFAELLITTGLRLQEASSLLLSELPTLDTETGSPVRSLAFRLAAATAKGSRGRDIRMPIRLIRQLHDYGLIERENALGRHRRRGRICRMPRSITVAAYEHRALRLADGDHTVRVSVDQLRPSDRVRLIDKTTGSPLALWLTEDGQPVSMAAWEAVFMRASERCRHLGFDDMHITPHMLRHSFAVHMLTLLLREQVRWVVSERSAQLGSAYRRMIGDPLLKLQRLMGHSRIESTYIYLDHLADSQEIVDAAVSNFGLDAGSEEFAP
ncbi:site-specific integrase [Ensifer sp. YR511]|uniref:tyrosine-type recombinase/integrase n=1 Tax=Ensifer sp. YR511 TaxID=1855294 RepID=UPI0008807E30|nr:site-specific integrase [Ensifer sp. YR511]SDN37994.1 Phage integrase family protein [Ensifer sp. YR511]SDN48191.1 Phage integrase family protein [Ensifer sp. YR511]SDN66454.1 Phage integrase family protein [Ensifer sp. YR511]SDN95083.1 Phage integrase family protein [Ensifer sp. YR511]